MPANFNSAVTRSSRIAIVLALGFDPVSSGPISGGADVAMSVIETSLAALKEGSALIAQVPFVGPVAGLILQALQMRGVRFPSLS